MTRTTFALYDSSYKFDTSKNLWMKRKDIFLS